MTRDEAEAEALLRRTLDGAGWLARRAVDGSWDVVRLSVPGLPLQRPSGAHVESRPKPPQADDPRPAGWRNVPPYGAGGG